MSYITLFFSVCSTLYPSYYFSPTNFTNFLLIGGKKICCLKKSDIQYMTLDGTLLGPMS